MLEIRRITAVLTLTALLFTAAGGAALAKKGEGDSSKAKVSEKFEDMEAYNWGLGDVVRLMVSGVFKGRSETEFAPGAAITRQEMAVAAVRLMGREAEAKALTEAEIEVLLSQIDDAAQIAAWARASVALLIDLEAIDGNGPFRPAEEATRLDVAVLLVRALGYTAEAEAKMDAQLDFADADQIPAELAGYVAVAVDHGLIKGYENATFRPERAVKRVEMAVMMGRADRQMERSRENEVKGTVTAVSSADGTITLQVGELPRTIEVAPEAAVFVGGAESQLADIAAGMRAEIKLNADGLGIYVEAESTEREDRVRLELRGVITGLIEADGEALAVVEVDGEPYALAATAVIRWKGQTLSFTDLQMDDQVEIHVVSGVITRIGVERENSADDSEDSSDDGSGQSGRGSKSRTVEGTISLITGLQVGPLGETRIMVAIGAEGEIRYDRFLLLSGTEILLDGEAAAITDLQVGDTVILTIVEGKVQKVEATR